MALKPTICKFNLDLADLERNRFDALNLTVALHPSEILERMMARVLAYCLNTGGGLTFTKGLSTPEVPDIWSHTLTGDVDLWIEVGEPAVERIRKAVRLADRVRIYSFNSRSSVWWSQNAERFGELPVWIFRFLHADIKTLIGLVDRNVEGSVTISGDTILVATDAGQCEVRLEVLQTPAQGQKVSAARDCF